MPLDISVESLLDEFPQLDWLRDSRRIGPFARTLDARQAALREAGIDLSIERNSDGPNRIRITAATVEPQDMTRSGESAALTSSSPDADRSSS